MLNKTHFAFLAITLLLCISTIYPMERQLLQRAASSTSPLTTKEAVGLGLANIAALGFGTAWVLYSCPDEKLKTVHPIFPTITIAGFFAGLIAFPLLVDFSK